MKAIASISNTLTKPSRTTVLFWAGWFLGLLAAILQLIIPDAQLVLFLIAVGGFALAVWQKIGGVRDQRQHLEQERKRNEAGAQDKTIHASEFRVESNVTHRALKKCRLEKATSPKGVTTPDGTNHD
jgi:hypothetical protein